MTSAQRDPEMFHSVVAQINPTLDALNNAFATLDQVVKARPILSTEIIVEGLRELLIDFVSTTTMQMNTGNLDGLISHLSSAAGMTENVANFTRLIRIQNESRGFHVS